MSGGMNNPGRFGVYRVARRQEAGSGAVRVDLAGVRDKAALLAALARALGFPDWFGGNWDALEDCLTDLSWRDPGEIRLVLEGWSGLEAEDLEVLIDVLGAAAAYWAGRGRRFVALFVGGPTTLPDLGDAAAT